MRQDFPKVYEDARQKHQELVSLPEDALAYFSNADTTEYKRELTKDTVAIFSVAPVAYGLTAVSGAAMWRLERAVAERLAAHDYRAMFQAHSGLLLGSGLVLMSVLTYFPLMPLLNRWFPTSLFREVNYKSARFIVTASVAVWAALGLAIITAPSLPPLSQMNLFVPFVIWLVPPLTILMLAPLAMLVTGTGILVRWRRSKTATSSIEVLRGLLEVLSGWTLGPKDAVSIESRRQTARKLSTIASKIKRLNFGPIRRGKDEEWAASQYALAADNLLVCGSWLYVSQAQSTEAVRSRVLAFCNAFLTGHLSDLPRLEVAEGLISPPPRRRVITTVFLTGIVLLYSVTPFMLFLALRHQLESLSAPTSIWLLLYSLWLVVGLFAYLEHTSQSAGETLLNLVKVILGK